MSTKRPKKRGPNLRTQVIEAAKEADVPLDWFDRAQVLAQIAALIAAHPRVGGMIAFKGGAIMHYLEQSPRFSKDLDGVLVAGRRIRAKVVKEALRTPEARKIVLSVGPFTRDGDTGLAFPVVIARPPSGKERVGFQLSINWIAPLRRKPERLTFTIENGREVTVLAIARVERMAEKVRAFLMRGRANDAFDLHQSKKVGVSAAEAAQLPELIAI